MNILDNLKDNTVIIIPNSLKKNIIKEVSKNDVLQNVKYISFEELKKEIFFNYNKQTIYYLMNKYSIKMDVAFVYIDNMYYIENKYYESKKLNILVEMKNDLENNGLLIKNDDFLKLFINKNIIVYGYDYINKFNQKIINILKINNEIEINKNQYEIQNSQKLFEFDNIYFEVEFVAVEIIKLLNNGVDINKIKLLNLSDEYKKQIKKIFSFFNIPIELNQETSIFSTKIVKEFLDNLKPNIKETLEYIEKKYSILNSKNLEIYNKIIKICNNYNWINDYAKIKDMLVNDLKHSNFDNIKYKNKIECINLKESILDLDNYYFLVGFNQGLIPTVCKDEEYISDNIKNGLDIETIIEKNKLERNSSLSKIKSIKNLTITYKLKEKEKEVYISTLNEDLNLEINKQPSIPLNYSNKYNKIKLTKMQDTFSKYGVIEKDLEILYNSYSNIRYNSYNNDFTGLNKDDLTKYINKGINLSYTTLDKYYKCAFRYYIEEILKIKKFKNSISTLVGNVYHEVLSVAFLPDFNFETKYNEIVSKLIANCSYKEKYFINSLKKDLEFIIENIKEQNKKNSLEKVMYEESFYIDKSRNIKITFVGKIDKLFYNEQDNKTTVAIIDYKTGKAIPNMNVLIHGLNMQLPMYLYSVKNSNIFKNVEIAGIYLQKILEDKKIDLKEKNIKLQGYSNSCYEIINKFDSSYEKSEVIKSLSVTQDNRFHANSKVLSNKQIDQINNLVDQKIEEAIDNILNANFVINPKRLDNDNLSCMHCKLKDVCNKKEKDFIDLEKYSKLEFLGGD